jgi:Gamma-glutamyl cyclotransferase, AIG2-like
MHLTEHLFSYGTLRYESVQRETFGRLLNGSNDALVGWRLEMVRITDPEVLRKSGEAEHPILVQTNDDADRVEGMVFAITPEELARADAYEVADYRRVGVTLCSGMRAWVYVSAT